MGWLGMDWGSIGKAVATGVASVAGGALGTLVCPGLGTAIGAGLASALVGGGISGLEAHSWDAFGSAALTDGIFGAIGGGMAGGAIGGLLEGGNTALLGATMLGGRTAANMGATLLEPTTLTWLGGAGLGSALASFTNADSPTEPKVTSLPTKILSPTPT